MYRTVPCLNTRAELIDALRLAVEIEHNLMCQYLFAAYSMKKFQHELKPAQLERARRWESLITLIARQEMEHLGLALNLITAIGGTPSFSRPNFPQRLDYYGAANIKSTLTRCNLATVQRFQRFEAPEQLLREAEGDAELDAKLSGQADAEKPGKGVPYELTDLEAPEACSTPLPCGAAKLTFDPIDPARALAWCQHKPRESAKQIQERMMRNAHARAAAAGDRGGLLGGAPHLPLVDSVQALYEGITAGLERVSRTMGEGALFIGKKRWQLFGGPRSPQYGTMNDLNQYGLDLIPVTDLNSALNAVQMILVQGEGIEAPPSYLPHTHFCMFTRIVEEMKLHGMEECAARPVVDNPMTCIQPDVSLTNEVNLITNEDTLPVARLFNHCYEVMLTLLLYLYSDAVKTEAQANALMDAAFFPFMTMFVRPLAELLTEMPAFNEGEVKTGNAGPGFELSGDVLNFPHFDQTWTLFQERIDALCAEFGALIQRGDRWKGSSQKQTSGQSHSRIFSRLCYMNENMRRLAEDWRSNWSVGRISNV